MRLSQKADYALRALFMLARETEDRAVPASEIARRESIPEKFLEQILNELRKASLVNSQRGAVGGYRLARPANAISVGEVWRVMDGPLSPVAGLDRPMRVESQPATMALNQVWERVEKGIAQIVDRITLHDLCGFFEEQSAVLDFSI